MFLSALACKASQSFTQGHTYHNIHFESGIVHTWANADFILLNILHKLSRSLGSGNTFILIMQNIDCPAFGHEPVDQEYRWAIMSRPDSIIIVCNSSIMPLEDYKAIVYYALTHQNELTAKQTQIQLPSSYTKTVDFAVADSSLNIDYAKNATEANNLIGNKKIYAGKISDDPGFSCYYYKGEFHFLHTNEEVKDRYPSEKEISGFEILSLKNPYRIFSFTDDHFIFSSNETFYRYNVSSNKVTGPYFIPDLKGINPTSYDFSHYEKDGELVIEVATYLSKKPEAIKFSLNKKSGKMTDNLLYFYFTYGYPTVYSQENQTSEQKKINISGREWNVKAVALPLIICINSILIFATARKL